jgi:hypothetical protein
LQNENKELKRKLANLADLNKAVVSEREIEENNVQVNYSRELFIDLIDKNIINLISENILTS